MTHEEIVEKLSQRIFSDQWLTLNWADVTGAVGGASAEDKTEIVLALRVRDLRRFGRVIEKLLKAWILAEAVAKVETDLADGSLNETELDKYLG